jgi:hypothetical protein
MKLKKVTEDRIEKCLSGPKGKKLCYEAITHKFNISSLSIFMLLFLKSEEVSIRKYIISDQHSFGKMANIIKNIH